MKYVKLFEQFLNEKLMNSNQFRKYVIETVAKKCPWAEITSEEWVSNGDIFDAITFDYAVKIYWQEGPLNYTTSMIRVKSDGRFQKFGLDPNNPNRPRFGEEIDKGTGWDKQENAIKTLITVLKKNSSNSPINNK